MLNTTKVFHTLLKQHHNNSKTLLPLLLILKCLARNCEYTRAFEYSRNVLPHVCLIYVLSHLFPQHSLFKYW